MSEGATAAAAATGIGAVVVVGSTPTAMVDDGSGIEGEEVGRATATVVVGAATPGMTTRSPTGTRLGLRMLLTATIAPTVTLNLRATALRLSPRRST